MNTFKGILILFLMTASLFSCKEEKDPLEGLTFEEQLKVLFPNSEISAVDVKDHFTEAFKMVLKQPLDHGNPEAGTFDHHIYLSHTDYSKPTVLVTEGYGAKHRTYELSKVLKSNQVMVEYRLYGNSRPTPLPWEHLTNDLAIEDYHNLVTKLKRLYKNKWLSTGISKGGETVLIYKSKYPEDIDVAVPYVAPLINTQEDPRTEEHINSVGTAECRAKVTRFQRLALENREAVLAEMERVSKEKEMTFIDVPMEEAFEYAVLEFPFSFWQWGGKCEDIPDEAATPEALFKYVNQIVGVGFYSDKGYYKYLPSFYQHINELGYYGFDTTPVKDLLKIVHNPTNKRFLPKGVPIAYNPDYIKNVRDYVETKGDKILYINGAYDTWGACAPKPKPNVDALKMTLAGGSHKTRIKHFSEEDQKKIYDKLQGWLGEAIELYPL